MTRTSPGPVREPGNNPDAVRPTRRERAVVLGGFALAALVTAWSAAAGSGLEAIAAAWLAAGAWAAVSSLALALRRGIRRGDWSAFRRCGLPRDTDTWSLKSGVDMDIAEQHERLMRGG